MHLSPVGVVTVAVGYNLVGGENGESAFFYGGVTALSVSVCHINKILISVQSLYQKLPQFPITIKQEVIKESR